MVGSQENAPISIKDAAVMIPLVASALAICWEVGSFIPIGGAAFSYFSFAEHLIFAAAALPLALLLATGICVADSLSQFQIRCDGHWNIGRTRRASDGCRFHAPPAKSGESSNCRCG